MSTEGADNEEEEAEEEEEKGKKRKKGKGKQEVRWDKIWGAGRCAVCIKEDTECEVNLKAVEQWREDVARGVVFVKHPAGTNCRLCGTVRKKPCSLPATAEMRSMMKTTPKKEKTRGDSLAPSASSSVKQKFQEVDVVVPPPPKRLRTEVVVSGKQEEFWGSVLCLMEVREAREAESSRRAEEREERLRAVLTVLADNVLQQTNALLRMEMRIRREDGADEDEDGEDGDDALQTAEKGVEGTEGSRETEKVSEE